MLKLHFLRHLRRLCPTSIIANGIALNPDWDGKIAVVAGETTFLIDEANTIDINPPVHVFVYWPHSPKEAELYTFPNECKALGWIAGEYLATQER